MSLFTPEQKQKLLNNWSEEICNQEDHHPVVKHLVDDNSGIARFIARRKHFYECRTSASSYRKLGQT